jgi:ferredoxin
MKQLRFRYTGSGGITTPFPIRKRTYKPSESLTATLCTLFPHKAGYFMKYNPVTLIIGDSAGRPFGPEPDTVRKFFFDDMEDAADAVRKRYREVKILLDNGPRGANSADQTGTTGRDRGSAVSLSLEEFHALYQVVQKNEQVNALLCSIFLNPDNLFTLFVPPGTTLKKLFGKVAPVSEHLKKHPTSKPYHPISGQEFALEEVTGVSTDLIAFSESGYVLSPGTGPLFGFPYWNRTLGMRPGMTIQRESQPCNNCLSCSRFCPAGIPPSHLYHNIIRDNHDEAEGLGLNLCIQCGICQFVCPAYLPLYSVIRGALSEYGGDE